MTPLCFLDTETDGVHPDRRVWEVAMIRRDDTGTRERQIYVDIDLSTADPFGLKVGGFYDRHPLGEYISGGRSKDPRLAEYPGMKSEFQAAGIVAQWTHGAHIVGAVPNFDTEVLARVLRENGLTPSWHYHLIDIEALMVGFLAAGGRSALLPWKSDDLSRAVGVEPPTEEERHTALSDALWAMRVYDAIVTP